MNFLNRLIDILLKVWIAHWMSHGKENLELHDKFSELYEDLKNYIDEYVETLVSIDKDFKILPLQFNIYSGNYDIIELLSDLRKDLSNIKEPYLQDLVGRMISTCNHYIFLFENKNVSEFFSKLRSKLVNAPNSVKTSFNEVVNYFDDYVNEVQDYQIVYVKQVGFQKASIEDTQVKAKSLAEAIKKFQSSLKKNKDIKISKVKAFTIDDTEGSTAYRSELRKELKGS